MSTTETDPAANPDPIAQAIAALTAAARGTKIRGEGTPHEQVDQADFAEVAAIVLTSVAANLGGVESLLAGRSGSWEADLVRNLVQGTALDDLERYRTEPLRITVFPEGDFYDLGLMDLYDHDLDLAYEREANEEQTGEEVAAASALVAAIERLWGQDQASYRSAYLETVRAELRERGITAEVQPRESANEPGEWNPLVDELHEHALKTTPLPMTGKAPDFSDGSPADAVRRAGLTYLERAQASNAPH